MSAKRILILNWRCPTNPLAGGAEMITLEHARAWVVAGHYVTWFAERYSGSSPYEDIDGIHIERYAYGNKMHSLLASFIYLLYLVTTIYRYWFVHKGKFDLIMDEIHGPSMWVTLWALKSKKMAYVHEVAQDIWDKMLPFPLNIVGRVAEKCMYLFYRTIPILTASQSTHEDLVRMGVPEKNITIIPHGLGLLPLAKPRGKERSLTLLFVARLVKMKGIEEAIDVLAHLRKSHSDVHLWIVGKGSDEYLAHLRSMLKERQLTKSATFFGHVSEEKKIELYQKAHFLIHTSIREGFGLVVIEANSQGTPALVYNSPGLRDLVKNGINGYVVPYGDSDELARKLVSIYTKPVAYEKLAKSSITYSRNFDWEAITKQSTAFINHILTINNGQK